MKIAWITTFYRPEELKDIRRLKKEVTKLNLSNWAFFVSDRRNNNQGYAAGINESIIKAYNQGYDLFIICNPDISITGITAKQLLEGGKHFDIWGGAMMQNNKTYYGGEIDKWRMSGGLIEKKPTSRFNRVDFVSGAFMIIKRNVIEKLGRMEEKYFIYYEEVDYCYQANKMGFKVGIDCLIKYFHFEKSDVVNPKKRYLLFRNRLLFFIKNSSWKQKIYEIIRIPKTIFEEFQLKSILRKNSFLFNFFSLNISSFLIKLINFANFLFLIRFLSSGEYGIYTLVWAQVMLLSPLVDFGTTSYGVVHLVNEKKSMLKSLLDLRLALSVIIFILTVILSLIFFSSNIKIYLYILITTTVIFTNTFSGSYLIINALKNKLYLSSRNSIIFNSLIIFFSIISLIIWKRLLILFLITFIGYNAYSLINIILIRKELGSFSFNFAFKDWLNILKRSYIYVLISFFAGFYFKIDVFLLQMMKGIYDVGIYSAGYKFFEGLLFLAFSYNMTATPILSRLIKNKYELFGKLMKDSIFLVFIGLSVVFIIQLLSPLLLPLIFKTTYGPSIQVLQIVILTLPFILINSVFMNLLYVLQKAKYVIYIFIIQTIINISLNIFFIPRYSYFGAAWVTVVSEFINFFFLFLICKRVWNIVFRNKSYEN